MNLETIPLREISTLAIGLPIIAGLRIVQTTEKVFQLFLIFLITGLLTDLSIWYIHDNVSRMPVAYYLSLLYSFIESVFFVWITTLFMRDKPKKIIRFVLFGTFTIGMFFLALHSSVTSNVSISSVYDTFYQIAASLLSGFVLLQMAERENQLTRIPIFWIMAGIFFYCFSTFFIFVIKTSMDTTFADRLWVFHDILNILTYILYTIGLLLASRKTIS